MSQALWQPSTRACTSWNLAQTPIATWQGWLHLEHMLLLLSLLQALRPRHLPPREVWLGWTLAIAERLWVKAEAEMTASAVRPGLGTEPPDALTKLGFSGLSPA